VNSPVSILSWFLFKLSSSAFRVASSINFSRNLLKSFWNVFKTTVGQTCPIMLSVHTLDNAICQYKPAG
jgi:hypothetical protein